MNIPIFLSSDDNYAPFVATTIASICDNTKSFIDFYILDGGIQPTNKQKIIDLKDKFNNFSVEFIPISISQINDYKNEAKHVSISTYNRLFIREVKPNIKRAIYLDVDLVCLGDIKELWECSLNGKTIGMVKDQGIGDAVINIMEEFNLQNYYNAGVLLIDLERWEYKNYTQKAFLLEKNEHDKIKFADQDLLNILFKDDCIELDAKFNVQYTSQNTIIRHYVNVYKPWKTNFFKIGNKISPLDNFDDFWKYVKKTEFYNDIKQGYEDNINKSLLNKRLSIMVENIRGKNAQ